MDAIAKDTATAAKVNKNYPTAVKAWLIIGVIMVFGQVVIGGITRLTGSGLSITKWDIVTGTVPPLSQQQWTEAFDLYKQTPQYHKINEGMTMREFKFIFFWEYFHRLWARSMGFVFLIPFLFFWWRGWLDKPLMRRLGVVVLLAALAASFGWIMVASGLIERPWVNAYKLTLHLSIAFIVYSYLLWTTFHVIQPQPPILKNSSLRKWTLGLTILLAVQIVLGGIMSGTKAALFYPTWPDMRGVWIPSALLSPSNWNVENFVQYDATPFMVAFIQVLHRNTAYLLTIFILYFFIKYIRIANISRPFKRGLYLLITMLVIQVLLGILTVINSKGIIPVGLGVMHQGGALILLTIFLFLNYQFAAKSTPAIAQ